MYPSWSSEFYGLWLNRGSLPKLGTGLLIAWMVSVPAEGCCPSFGMEFCLCICMTSDVDVAGGSLRFRGWTGFWCGRGYVGQARAVWGAVLPEGQDSDLASGRRRSFLQMCRPGHSSKELRGLGLCLAGMSGAMLAESPDFQGAGCL